MDYENHMRYYSEQTLKEQRLHETSGFPCAYYDSHGEPPFLVKHHWHQEIELIYFREGTFSLEINTEKFHIAGDCFCFINPGELHAISSDTPYSENALVWDPALFYSDTFEDAGQQLILSLLHQRLSLPRFIRPGDPLFEPIRTEYCTIMSEYPEPESPSHFSHSDKREQVQSSLLVRACLLKIIALLAKYDLLLPNPHEPNEHIELLKSVLTFMKEHYARKISIHDLAQVAAMSDQYFCRFFKKMIGKPPMKYLNELRIRQATYLLKESSLSVMDICLECGFHNLGNFMREFRNQTGTTPLQYRKEQ